MNVETQKCLAVLRIRQESYPNLNRCRSLDEAKGIMSKFHKLVEKQRRKLALKFHPDMGGNEDKMKEINNAADFLLNLKVIQPRPQVVFDMSELLGPIFRNVTFDYVTTSTMWTRKGGGNL